MPMTDPTINRWGQYVIDGQAYQRVTTLAGLMEARHNLEKWGKRNVARGLTLRPDVLAAIAACPDEDKGRLDHLCEQALEAAAGSAGSTLGTALHEMTARVDSGEKFMPPPPWDVDIKAYRDLLEKARIAICPAWIEQTCVVPGLGVAGTFDRIVEVKDRLWVADLKTGKSLDYGWCAIAIQLSCYAHAEYIWDWEHGARNVMPEVDKKRGLVIHLPAGTGRASLHVVNLEAGWEAAKQAMWVREWRARKDLARSANI
jgi:hypothetical protein